MHIPFVGNNAQRRILAMVLSLVACLALVATLKLPGLLISALLALAAYIMVSSRPDASDLASLRTSIELSAEDLQDVLDEFNTFCSSEDPNIVADRMLQRPALADADCTDPDISAFHYEKNSAQRFLRRLGPRLYRSDAETAELETLLRVTDERVEALQEAWLKARRSAVQLGPGYGDESAA